MKTEVIKIVCKSVVSGFLLAGMAYSLLVITAKPAYAASCTNCSEELTDAHQFCQRTFGNPDLVSFSCSDGYISFLCVGDHTGQFQLIPCD
jgi:hypothetical protein